MPWSSEIPSTADLERGFTLLGVLFVSVRAFIIGLHQKRTNDVVNRLEISIDGRLDKLLELAAAQADERGKLGYAEGLLAGRAAERGDTAQRGTP